MSPKLDFLNGIYIKIKSDRILLLAIAFCFIGSIFYAYLQQPKTLSVQEQTIDTYIPAGHSLVPIDIEMSDKLDSLVGQFALVNLYLIHPENKNRFVAKAVKLVRAPKNPNVFAILVPYEYVKWFMSLEGRFRISIASKAEKIGTFLVNTPAKKRFIQYGVRDVDY